MRMLQKKYIGIVLLLLVAVSASAQKAERDYIRKGNRFFKDSVYVDAEVKSAVGRADVVIKMQDAIYVFEFKVDGTPEEALAQINSKQYAIPYQADHRKVVKVGVNFDSSMRTIGEWIIEN